MLFAGNVAEGGMWQEIAWGRGQQLPEKMFQPCVENALRVFPLCFPHGVINYFMSLRNVIKSNNKIYCKGDTGQR